MYCLAKNFSYEIKTHHTYSGVKTVWVKSKS